MSRESDIRRARKAVREVLRGHNALEQALGGCSDQHLRSILSDVSYKRARQTARLLSWLQEREGLAESGHDSGSGEVVSLPDDEKASFSQASLGQNAQQAYQRDSIGARGSAQVLERREVTADLLIFKVSRPAGFTFRPGQAVKLGVAGTKRRYSIVSAPHEPFLEFFIELIPGGQMSERLQALAEGDTVSLDEPKGGFLLDERFLNHLMVATVTGINPFVSIVRDYLHQSRRGHRFFVLQGASYSDEFGYSDELSSLAAAHPDVLTYVATVSRPDESRNLAWTGEHGRVGSIVEKYRDRAGLDKRSAMVYACGNPEMVNEVEQRYRAQEFEVRTERYD